MLDGALDPDWLCHCFDHAVMWFGKYVENALQELDEHTHERVHTLQDLLGVKPHAEMDDVRDLISMFGMVDRRKG